MNTRHDIGAKIKQRRREMKISQEELANLTGVARQTVSAWEQNAFVPKGNNLVTLSHALKVPINFFVECETCELDEETSSRCETTSDGEPLSFALAPFAQIYDYVRTRARNGTRESRAEAVRIRGKRRPFSSPAGRARRRKNRAHRASG